LGRDKKLKFTTNSMVRENKNVNTLILKYLEKFYTKESVNTLQNINKIRPTSAPIVKLGNFQKLTNSIDKDILSN
jgi:hypothetical protein